MKKDLQWKVVLIIVLIALSLWSAYPLKDKIKLGLDLQGGVHLLLQVDTKKALDNEVIRVKNILKRNLDEKKFPFSEIKIDENRNIILKIQNRNDVEGVKKLISKDFRELKFSSEKEAELIYSFDQGTANNYMNLTVQQAIEIIRNRVDKFGVSEPVIQAQGKDRIVIQLPGLDDPERAKKIIQTGGVLEFKIVKGEGPSPEDILKKFNNQLPDDLEILPNYLREQEGGGIKGYLVVTKEAQVSGRYLKDARVGQDENGMPSVSFEFDGEGANTFGRVTEENIGKQLAIVLDKKIQSAPVIRSKISDRGQITGNFSYEEAKDLVVILRAGALPAEITYLEERTVGPSLGADSIRAGVTASILGFMAIVVFMVIYYKWSGFVANFALLLNGILLLGAMSYFKFTLTLPGIAGIALTLGMAVDANVLIYERIREEMRLGRTIKSAVQMGFSRAFATILDSNVTTLIAGVVLFQFGTGSVKGFAVTLSIGLIISMFTAVFVSRVIFDLRLASRKIKKLSI